MAFCLIASFAGCATLPPPGDRPHSSVLADTAGTRLGRALAPAMAAHPGKTGIQPLDKGRDAFAARGRSPL